MKISSDMFLLLASGFLIGVYCRNFFAARAEERWARQLAAARKREEEGQSEALRRQQNYRENTLEDIDNQIRFIEQCDLYAAPPVNKEASRILYALEAWIKENQPSWRLSFEVSMGAFIKTRRHEKRLSKAAFSSYNSKRVDFLLIDQYGRPMLVVEYNGSGHELADDAAGRMAVKRLALNKADIPVVEIPFQATREEINGLIAARLKQRMPCAG